MTTPNLAEYLAWPEHIRHIYDQRVAMLRGDALPATKSQDAIARAEARAAFQKEPKP